MDLSGFELATHEHFDLIILDIMLPGQSGLTVCQKLREAGSSTPILMLTARRQTKDKVAGLRAGGDDYLTKPFQMAELVARVEALLRRPSQVAGAGARFQFGTIHIDTKRMEVTRDGKMFPCRPRSFNCCAISRSITAIPFPATCCCAKSGDTARCPRRAPWTYTSHGFARSWKPIPRIRN